MFDDAIARMIKARIKTESEIGHFRNIQERVQEIVKQRAEAEEDYGEIPDEFKGEHWFEDVPASLLDLQATKEFTMYEKIQG